MNIYPDLCEIKDVLAALDEKLGDHIRFPGRPVP